MTTYLLTTDKRVQVVPTSLISGWNYLTNVREELGCQEDELIPIPLSNEQCDIWLDLCIQMEARFLTECEVHDDKYFVNVYDTSGTVHHPMEQVPLLKRSEVVPIVRSMDPAGTDWVMYCQLDTFEEIHKSTEDDDARKRIYVQLGRVVRDQSIECKSHPLVGSLRMDSNPESGLLFSDWELCWGEAIEWQEKNQELLKAHREEDVWDLLELEELEVYRALEKPSIVTGIVYATWLKMGYPAVMQWDDLDWNEFIKMGVASAVFSMMTGRRDLAQSEKETSSIPTLISILAHDRQRDDVPLVSGFESHYLTMHAISIFGSQEYQRRLGLWYERLFAESPKEQREALIGMANLHRVVMRRRAHRGSPFSLRSDMPTSSTKRLLAIYVEFCQERLATFADTE